MYSANLVHFAAKLATESETLIYYNHDISDGALCRYWIASRCRLQNWLIEIKSYEAALRANSNSQLWIEFLPFVEDIFNTEVLTRVWSAVLNGINQIAGIDDYDCIGRGVLMGHMEAKKRVLQLLLPGQAQPNATALVLDKMRRKAERWIDILIAIVNRYAEVAGFGYNESRVESISTDLRTEMMTESGAKAIRSVILATVRQAYVARSYKNNYTRQNAKVAASILDAISPKIYNGIGKPYSCSDLRLLNASLESISAPDIVFGEKKAKDWF